MAFNGSRSLYSLNDNEWQSLAEWQADKLLLYAIQGASPHAIKCHYP